MEYIATFFSWLQKLFAESALGTIIILLLAVLCAVITDDWMNEEFFNIKEILKTLGITKTEYWLFLIAIYGIFFLAVKIVDSLIAVVFLTNTEKK